MPTIGVFRACVLAALTLALASPARAQDAKAPGKTPKTPAAKTPAAKTPAAKPAAAKPPADGSRDLLAALDLKALQIAGAWKQTNGVLESPVGERARMFLPGDVPEEYQLDFVAERIQGKDALAIGIVVGGRTTSIMLEAYGGKASGLHLVGEVGCNTNATSYQQPIFAPGKKVKIGVTVRKQSVALVCDDEAIFTWHGSPQELSLFAGWSVKGKLAIWVGAHQSVYRIHSARIGPAPQLEPEPDLTGPLPSPQHKQPRPIPVAKQAFTNAKRKAAVLEFQLRRVDDYRQLTTDPPAVRDEAAKYLAAVETAYSQLANAKTWQDLRKQGLDLVTRGAADPLVKSAVATACQRSDKPDEEKRLRREAEAGFANTKYRAVWQLLNAQRRRYHGRLTPDDRPTTRNLARITAAVAAEKQLGPGDQRLVFEAMKYFFDGSQRAEQTMLYELCRKQPGIDPWTLNMLSGMEHVKAAWSHRGGGYANEVGPEGWKQFEKSLKLAAWHLTQAWQQRPEFPEAATEMIAVAMGGGSEAPPRLWFDEAVAAQMDYGPAYYALAWALRPRWGGSIEAMLDFGKTCAATKRYDTDVPHKLLSILDDVRQELGDKEGELWKIPGVYSAVREVMVGMAAEPSRADDQPGGDRAWTLSQWIGLAVDADELEDARFAYEQVGDKFDPRPLKDNGQKRPEFVISRIYALAGQAYGDLKQAEGLLFPIARRETAGNRQKALAIFDAALKANTDKRALAYLQTSRETVAREIAYEAGKWTPLKFQPELFWRMSDGWKVEGPDSAVGKFNGGIWMVGAGIFPLPCEMTLELEQLDAGQTCMVGPMLGAPNERHPGLVAWVDTRRKRLGATVFDEFPRGVDIRPQKINRLHVRVWPERWEYYCNGEGIEEKLKEPIVTDGLIGIGSPFWLEQPGGTFRIRNVQIRKLDIPPTPDFADSEARVAHYTKLLADQPGNLRAHFLRGVARYYTPEKAEGLADLELVYKQNANTPFIQFWLGVTYKALDQTKPALEFLTEAHKRDPQGSAAMMLADIYASHPDASFRNPAKALELAEKANQIEKGKDADCLSILAAAQAVNGKFDLAQATLKKALDLANDKQRPNLEKRLAKAQRKELLLFEDEPEKKKP